MKLVIIRSGEYLVPSLKVKGLAVDNDVLFPIWIEGTKYDYDVVDLPVICLVVEESSTFKKLLLPSGDLVTLTSNWYRDALTVEEV